MQHPGSQKAAPATRSDSPRRRPRIGVLLTGVDLSDERSIGFTHEVELAQADCIVDSVSRPELLSDRRRQLINHLQGDVLLLCSSDDEGRDRLAALNRRLSDPGPESRDALETAAAWIARLQAGGVPNPYRDS